MPQPPNALLDERLAFCDSHQGGSVPSSDIRSLLTDLISGPSSVLDLADGEGRAVLAVLVDGAANVADAAELALLGHRRGPASEALAEAALAWALARARQGPRTCLEVPGPEHGLFSAALLQRSGLAEAYQLHEMERPPSPPPARPPLPAGMRMADIQPAWIPSLHEATSRAFATVPGAFVPPLPEFTTRTLTRPIPPRVVLAGERVAGFVRVFLEPSGTGWIQTLGRHPDFSGAGLGPVLLAEGLHMLAERQAGPIRLEVAVENERALGLYQRAGFAVVRSTSTWRQRLVRAG